MTSILHFSDPHVQEPVLSMPPRDLLSKRLVGAANLWARRGKYFRDAPQKLEQLAAFRRERAIDLAICTGDHTALGTDAEHRAARAALRSFEDAPHGLITIAGNHDLYLPDTVREGRFERHFGDLLKTDLPQHAVDGVFPFARLIDDDVAVIGVGSARPNPHPLVSSGRVPEEQLAALPALLDALADRVCIVMLHYAPLKKNGQPDTPRHGLEQADALLRVCARPRVVMVHGHIHHRYAHPERTGRCWLFGAGSATYTGREGFWLYEVEHGRLRARPGAYRDGAYRLEDVPPIEASWS